MPLLNNFNLFGGGFDLAASQASLASIEKQLSAPGAWDKPENLTPLLKEKSRLEAEINRNLAMEKAYADVKEWLFMAEEGEEEALAALDAALNTLQAKLDTLEMSMLLSREEDSMDAILEIHPGAGGTEAQDWAEMLERMYNRWVDNQGYKAEILDYLPGDEAGIKSVTLRIIGDNAYGLLQGEKGIHRLIRISPFDASGRRHTSFASVDVIPDAGDSITIDIKETDLRIDVYRASGAGGQHVNKTESAVRITHLPTGIVAQCQNEKSQHSNKESAMRILKARIYAFEQSKVDAIKQADYAGKNAISFGSQIRTYTLQPFQLAKDHRTNTEVGDVNAVLDGHIDPFLRAYLFYQYEQRNQ